MKLIATMFCLFITAGLHLQVAYGQSGDATNGAVLYSQQCDFCHGESGQGITAPPLVGCGKCDSLDLLFDKIDSSMPRGNAGACVDQCARDIAAYVFEVFNGNSTTTVPATTTSSIQSSSTTTTTSIGASSTTTTSVTETTTTTMIETSPCVLELLYGENSEEIGLLRYFRDKILPGLPGGRGLITLYEKWNPLMIELIVNNELFGLKLKAHLDVFMPALEIWVKHTRVGAVTAE